ncbi:hypothetical protein EVA_09550 [gut metagenome]|uniref:Uncharacterized protein n=1 Tax=gut metagenome TaxID=749906 RepID=J9G645_9ZZZZ
MAEHWTQPMFSGIPVVVSTVKGVLVALHSDFVAIINARYTR